MADNQIDPKDLAKALIHMQDMKSEAEHVAEAFKDFRDFTKAVQGHMQDVSKSAEDIAKFTKESNKFWSNTLLKGILGGAEGARKLLGYMEGATKELAQQESLMETFQERSIKARFAVQEIANAQINGNKISKAKLAELNKEINTFQQTKKSIASDELVNQSMIDDFSKKSNKHAEYAVTLSRHLVEADVEMLQKKRALWASGQQTLEQLEAQTALDLDNISVTDMRIALLQKKVASEKAIEILKERQGKADQVEKESIKEQIKLEKEKIKSFKEQYAATSKGNDSAEMSVNTSHQLNGLLRRRTEVYNSHVASQVILNEAKAEQARKDMVQQKWMGGYLQHINRQEDARLGILGDQYTSIKNFLNTANKIPKPFMLFDALLRFGVERFIALDKAAEEFRKTTGFSINQMKELRKDAEAVNSQFASMGVSIEAAYKSAKALTDVFGRTSLVSKEALKNTALLSANLGVAEESTANVLANFQGLGGATQEAAMNVVKVGAGISEKAGVPFKLVMQDVANSSETTLSMLGANPSKLMKSAIAARAMGMELNKMVESQRKMLDFSSSINDELNASALLGKNINFQLARQYAFEGRVEDSARATLETVKRAGDFNRMNVYQREALAKAAGMELKDLTKMMAVDAQREAIMNGTDETKKKILIAQEAELKKLKEKEKLDSEDLVKQNEKALMQQKIQGTMTNINNLLDAMKLAFAEILEPIITPLAKLLVPLLKVVAFVLKGLLSPLKILGEIFGSIIDFISGMVDGMGSFGEAIKTTITWILGIGSGILLLAFFGKAGVVGLLGSIGSVFSAIGSGFASLFKVQTWKNLWSGFTEGASAAKKTIVSMWNKEGGSAGGIGESLKSGFDKLKEKFSFGKGATAEIQGPPAPPTTATPSTVGAGDVTKTTAEAAKSSDGIKEKAGQGLKDFLENLAAGLKSMKGMDVLFGALNLIPASLGLVVMIPGFFGAKLLERLDGEKVKAGLEGLSAGIKSMASTDVLLGAGALMLASLALVIMVPGLIGMAGIALLGTPFSAGLVAMSAGLAALGGNPIAWLGIAAIGALSLAFIGFAFGIKLISEGLSTVVSSFTVFADLDWSTIAKGLSTMLGLGVVAAALGLALPLIIGGAFAIGVLGVAMIGFGKAIEIARPGLESLGALLDRFAEIGADGLLKTAFGITALSGALAAFGAGSAAAGLGSFAGKLLGGDPIKRLQRFIDIGPKLRDSADSIDKIASATAKFGMIDAFAMAVDRLVYSLQKLNDQLDKTNTLKVATLSVISAMTQKDTETPTTTTTTETTGGGLEAKLDELITLLKDGAISIDLDGERVSRAMAARGRE